MPAKTKQVTIDLLDADERETISYIDFVERLNNAHRAVLPEWRDSMSIRLWAQGDYAHAYLEVRYERPETYEEMTDRETKEAEHNERVRKANEARERAEYARLHAKYGDGATTRR